MKKHIYTQAEIDEKLDFALDLLKKDGGPVHVSADPNDHRNTPTDEATGTAAFTEIRGRFLERDLGERFELEYRGLGSAVQVNRAIVGREPSIYLDVRPR